MEEEEFARLAERYHALARRDPGRYRRRVTALAALGYGYLAGVLPLLVVGSVAVAMLLERIHAGVVGAKLVMLQVALAWAVARSLWVRFAPGKGIDITPAEAPRLFETIDEVRAAIRARPVKRVAITPMVNAALGEYPRLGIFGWWRSDLFLGLPLLAGMDAAEARAVIAHELAHLSREHGRAAMWPKRVSRTWRQLALALKERGRGGWIFAPFGEWYVPRLNAAMLAMDRADEFEADHLAARAAGAAVHARALARLEVLHRRESRAWPAFTDRADHEPAPPCGWVSALCGVLREPGVGDAGAECLRERMAAATGPFAIHPALGERLRAIGVDQPPPEALLPVARSAADELLGPLAERLAAELDRRWTAEHAGRWRRRHERSQAELRRLAELDARADALDDRAALERAYLVSAWRGVDEARSLFAALADALPEARTALGRLMLAAGEEAGLAEMERAIAADPSQAPVAGFAAAAFLHERGREDEAARWMERAEREQAEDEAAVHERRTLRADEPFIPHAATPAQLRLVTAALRGEPRVRRAWLVKRVPRHRPERPAHLLVLQLSAWRVAGPRVQGEIVERVLHGIAEFVGCNVALADAEKSGKKAARIPGARVFDRAKDRTADGPEAASPDLRRTAAAD